MLAPLAAADQLAGNKATQPATLLSTTQEEGSPASRLALDDWQLDEDMDAADRLIRRLGACGAEKPHRPSQMGQDSAIKKPPTAAPRSAVHPRSARSGVATSFLTWTLLSLGLMAFIFGAVLLTWSFATDRIELWRLGMPFALGGQAGLVLGLVFQLDGLWRNHRASDNTLADLDHQISELRHATTLLTSSQSASAQSFYLHMAEGASPHLLLADVKGQLDILAQRMADVSSDR